MTAPLPTAHALTPVERAQCATLAALLRTSSLWGQAALLAVLAGVLTLVLTLILAGALSGVLATTPVVLGHGGPPPHGGAAPGVIAPLIALPATLLLALLVFERFLATRVQLDAQLFERLACAEIASLAVLDTALHTVLNVPPSKAGRPLAARLAGAQRLYRTHLATVLLLLCSAGAWTVTAAIWSPHFC